ncbi:iduronate 2-sulfatase-like isoform X2 [Sycon ciliatum]|uniref:iduronate 2-sulfatase-like isoform X2 n=1 Tax=Sycon ciliatum TaxID=27933 RepID=UPI0031F6C02A|eukprot:scpid53415/ scgid10331/ Iduronate 2-sulfatase; Alpha-L-iduronate sulfate sulfatase; Iduronate 2-sulfatase 42 kDa chain; Iduronate 2-sulfatase 14 kDa chain
MAIVAFATALALLLSIAQPSLTSFSSPKNVLMIAVDDLRPHFGQSYDTPQVLTPNMDKLAQRGVTFKRTYCQAATCGVSRSSLLTGRRPDTTHVLSNGGCFRNAGNWTSLPHFFKKNGYTTAGGGKIFHPGVCDGLELGEDRLAWSLPYYHAPCPQLGSLPCAEPRGFPHRNHSWISNETATDDQVPDGMIALNAISQMHNLSKFNAETPFFLAVGFHKPHLPHFAPKKYFDMYPLEKMDLPANPNVPKNLPNVTWNNCNEFLSYNDSQVEAHMDHFSQEQPLSDAHTRIHRRAYYATTTFVDAQVGRVLDALDELGLTNDTVVMLWGDHGWHLGENNEWAKHTNFEHATHVPLFISAPGGQKGAISQALTELVDVYPTLAELAGLPVPTECPSDSKLVDVCTEGRSLAPLVMNPAVAWSPAAFSQWPKGGDMGYTMRTQRYRYTEWVGYNKTSHGPIWSKLLGTELYDFMTDPNETVNHAQDSAMASLVTELSHQLHAGWRNATVSTVPS